MTPHTQWIGRVKERIRTVLSALVVNESDHTKEKEEEYILPPLLRFNYIHGGTVWAARYSHRLRVMVAMENESEATFMACLLNGPTTTADDKFTAPAYRHHGAHMLVWMTHAKGRNSEPLHISAHMRYAKEFFDDMWTGFKQAPRYDPRTDQHSLYQNGLSSGWYASTFQHCFTAFMGVSLDCPAAKSDMWVSALHGGEGLAVIIFKPNSPLVKQFCPFTFHK